jgi:hypothetical protein
MSQAIVHEIPALRDLRIFGIDPEGRRQPKPHVLVLQVQPYVFDGGPNVFELAKSFKDQLDSQTGLDWQFHAPACRECGTRLESAVCSFCGIENMAIDPASCTLSVDVEHLASKERRRIKNDIPVTLTARVV